MHGFTLPGGWTKGLLPTPVSLCPLSRFIPLHLCGSGVLAPGKPRSFPLTSVISFGQIKRDDRERIRSKVSHRL